jgi:hypothetical protein
MTSMSYEADRAASSTKFGMKLCECCGLWGGMPAVRVPKFSFTGAHSSGRSRPPGGVVRFRIRVVAPRLETDPRAVERIPILLALG